MKDDPEVSKILNRLHSKSTTVPKYVFSEVNFSLILMRLSRQGMSYRQIGEHLNAKHNTVRKWAEAVNRPRCRMMAEGIVTLGIRFLLPEQMAECGVMTDQYKLQQMARAA